MTDKIYDKRWKVINPEKPLGKGGQGITYLVEDLENDNKIYVLKRLKDKNRIERFRTEIDTIKNFNHPNIIKYQHSNLETAKPYHVTEYCAGGELTFEKVFKLSTIEKLSLFSTICKAIGYAHANKPKSIIHRDIKPANILLRQDERIPIITDFGICFNTEEGLERLTETMEQAGARFYMAPELANGRTSEITPRCDVYSLGKLLYWIFKGRIFDREDFIYDNENDLRNLSDIDPSMHFIYEIFEKTIKYNPNDRFSNANELAKEIDKTSEIISKDGHYLDINTPQKCMFCANGKYAVFAVPTDTYGKIGNISDPFHYFQNKSDKAFCLVCENCGNIQFFTLTNTKQNSWKI